MREKNLLIIFARNLIYGKVKTRLAAAIGHAEAFNVYKDLIAYTSSVTKHLPCDKMVYYSEYIEQNDDWNNCFKAKQQGNDLGERMMNAFKDAFEKGYSKTAIIGTDCSEITSEIIIQAFEQLNQHDIAIGPAADGGYYLLGMKWLHQSLFQNIAWSTNRVFDKTVAACNQLNLNYFLLQVLNDIDEEKDLKR